LRKLISDLSVRNFIPVSCRRHSRSRYGNLRVLCV